MATQILVKRLRLNQCLTIVNSPTISPYESNPNNRDLHYQVIIHLSHPFPYAYVHEFCQHN